MTTIIQKEQILGLVSGMDLISQMEEGFIQYSKGQTVVPPVGELLFEDPKGETHIKYGYVKRGEYYCVKIASGFPDNEKMGIPSSQGMMLLFSQKTGEAVGILLDEGYLTDIRTAAAGALAAQYFAPGKINAIGIIGTGIQARLQLDYLKKVISCQQVFIWGRSQHKLQKIKDELEPVFNVHIVGTTSEVAQNCNLIVTATASEKPLLFAKDIRPGTHITAVGSDTADKQELESEILGKADLVISDSIPQSKSRGEVYRATKDGVILDKDVVELGDALQNVKFQRSSDQQITVVDLTGVAVQDIKIAEAVYNRYINQ